MRALEALSDESFGALAYAMTLPGLNPARKRAPSFYEWFHNVVAAELARRRGIENVREPHLLELTDDELDMAAHVLLGMASACHNPEPGEDRALAEALEEIARGFVDLLRDRAQNAGRPGH